MTTAKHKALTGQVALVAGATRGAGRGIAVELGAAGATVYCTGRSVRGAPSALARPETIEETAELVSAAGGTGIWVQVDHSDAAQVQALIEQIKTEQGGQLDVLVNDIWGGEQSVEWGKAFWELDMTQGLALVQQAIFTHLITSRYVTPLLLARGHGLIVEITDGDSLSYRGNLLYDFIKTGVMRLALAMAEELKPHGISAVALTPGFLRSEEMLERFKVTEANWRDGAKLDPHFIASETPHYIGRAVAALASDPAILTKTGQALSTWGLYKAYGFTDSDGSQPDWGAYFKEHIEGER